MATTTKATTVKAATTPAPVSRKVYGSGSDLQMAKGILGNTGYTYIDTSLPKYVAPKTYGSSDINLNQMATPTTPGAMTGADYLAQVKAAMANAANVTGPVPTYDKAADLAAVNAGYDAQAKAIQTRNDLQTTQGVENLQRSAADESTKYQESRNQIDVQNAQQQRVLNDQMANLGLLRSGRNITSESILGAARTNAIGTLTAQEQKMLDDTSFKINQLKAAGASENNAQLADLEARRQEAITAANDRAFQNEMTVYQAKAQKSQSDLANLVTTLKTAYDISQDDANRLMQNKTFNFQMLQAIADKKSKDEALAYQKAQDAITNARLNRQLSDQEAETAYQHAQDKAKAALARAAALSKAAKSGGSGGNTQADVENSVWAQYFDALNKGDDLTFLQNHMRDIVQTAGPNGAQIYASMQKRSSQQTDEQRQKLRASYVIDNNLNPFTTFSSSTTRPLLLGK